MESNSTNNNNNSSNENNNSSSNTNNQFQISFLDAMSMIPNPQQRRRIIPRRIPRRHPRGIPLLSSTFAPLLLPQTNNNNTSNTNQTLVNDHNSTEISQAQSSTVPNFNSIPAVEEEDEDDDFYDSSPLYENHLPFEISERNPLSSSAFLFNSFNEAPDLSSDSDSDSPPPTIFAPFFGQSNIFRMFPSRMRSSHETEDDESQTRLQHFQHRFNSLVSYGEEEEEEHSSPSTSIHRAADSSYSSDENDEELRIMPRAAMLERIRRRITGSQIVSDQRRFEKLLEDRFSYFLPVIHNWDRKVTLATSYLRYNYIPPRK